MKLISTGKTHFDKKKFMPITGENKNRNMSEGGLWASPFNTDDSWMHWCKKNKVEEAYNIKDYFIFYLKPGSKILTLSNRKDLEKIYIKNEREIDFLRLSKEYDAIHLTTDGKRILNYYIPTGVTFYGWQSNTVLVLNKDCIKTELEVGDIVYLDTELDNHVRGTPCAIYSKAERYVFVVSIYGVDMGHFTKQEQERLLTFSHYSGINTLEFLNKIQEDGDIYNHYRELFNI